MYLCTYVHNKRMLCRITWLVFVCISASESPRANEASWSLVMRASYTRIQIGLEFGLILPRPSRKQTR